MPPDRRIPMDAREWLRRARSNLARARAGRASPEVMYEDLCFDAQQAAEKAVKAVLVDRKVSFPKTHSITELLTLLEHAGELVPADVRQAAILTGYAVETRYPGLAEEVTDEDHAAALALAERVVAWAEAQVASGIDGENQ